MADATKKAIRDYRDLLVWQKAMDLVAESYQVSNRLPRKEIFGFISQMQRAAVSIPANIAEGNGRRHLGDYIHHLSIANGSLKELETHFHFAVRLRYLQIDSIATALQLSEDVGRLLTALIQKLESRER